MPTVGSTETHSSTCLISASPVGFHFSLCLSKQITSPKIMDEASPKMGEWGLKQQEKKKIFSIHLCQGKRSLLLQQLSLLRMSGFATRRCQTHTEMLLPCVLRHYLKSHLSNSDKIQVLCSLNLCRGTECTAAGKIHGEFILPRKNYIQHLETLLDLKALCR